MKDVFVELPLLSPFTPTLDVTVILDGEADLFLALGPKFLRHFQLKQDLTPPIDQLHSSQPHYTFSELGTAKTKAFSFPLESSKASVYIFT